MRKHAFFAALVTMAAASVSRVHAAEPEDAPKDEAPTQPSGDDEDGPWAVELIVVAEPEQPKDPKCAPNFDCLTPAKAYFGGAIRGSYQVPEEWSLGATLGLATHVDQEERPPGYTALTLRVDFQLEIGRASEDFGAALRASPVAVLAWSDQTTAFATDVPGFALVLGTLEYWGEMGIRTLPTPSDPRGFHLAFGFALGRWSGTAGVGTFGTLGYRGDEVDTTSPSIGAYGDITVAVTRRFDIRLMVVASSPVLLSAGFGWRFAR